MKMCEPDKGAKFHRMIEKGEMLLFNSSPEENSE